MNGRVYLQFRRLLVDDGCMPGSQIDMDELARRVGSEPDASREALAQLEREGFVVRCPEEGLQVRSFQPDDIRELVRARAVTETAIGRLVVDRATDDELRNLGAMQRAAETLLAHGGDAPQDRNFHGAIARLAREAELERDLGLAYDQLRMARPSPMRTPSRSREAWREHRVILRALVARDGDATEAAVEVHLRSIEAAILGGLD